MLCVCGIVEREPTGEADETLTRMVAARRGAHAHAPVLHKDETGSWAHVRGTLVQAHGALMRGWLWRPLGEGRAADEAALRACVARIAAGGELTLAALGGAFVLLLVDSRQGDVWLANDRFGICPVYYVADTERLLFASDADAVAAAPRFAKALDVQALYDYMFFHCIPSPRSVYRDMRKLAPASLLRWRAGRAQVAAYWMPDFAAHTVDSKALQGQLVERLDAAVAHRARPRCGAFLSGGLDSSSVAGMLARHSEKAQTFTIGFDAAGYDESGYARIAARHFNTDHHEYFVTPDDVRESLPVIAAQYDEPFGNSSVIPTYHCARFAREHGIELMLAGDGGDELFAGNSRYLDQRVFENYGRVPAPLRAALEFGYRALPVLSRLPLAGKGARYIEQARMGLPDRLQSYNFLHRFSPAQVFQGEWLAAVDQQAPWQMWRARFNEPPHADTLQRMLYLDWKFTLADNDLVKVNRMGDLAGVEVCYPMLDHEVVQLSTTLSAATLLSGGELRGFYKQAFSAVLPREIITKSKHGFGLPFGLWMRNDRGLQTMVADAFASIGRRGIFANNFLDEVLRLFRDEAAGYYGELVWIITMLELWLSSRRI